ncbi:MAG: very short patch repair endonuclease [Flavisolibacter sp.]
MDTLNKEQRRKNMQANRSSGTTSEILLARALWSKGYRYRKNDKSVLGKPDITFKKFKIAIFIDGEFWHGKDWETKKIKITHNPNYWIKKIERNIERDKTIRQELEARGWAILRFWHKDVRRNLTQCVEAIENVISQKRLSE